MLEVSSWVLVHVGKILIKQIYMQTTLDNDITVNLTKLSFSLLPSASIYALRNP